MSDATGQRPIELWEEQDPLDDDPVERCEECGGFVKDYDVCSRHDVLFCGWCKCSECEREAKEGPQQ